MASPQELQLELIRRASFNDFDGDRVADDLLLHRELWSGALIDGLGLVKLRDLDQDVWNVDTLYVLSSGRDDESLEALARTWKPDALGWQEGDEAGSALGVFDGRRILVGW